MTIKSPLDLIILAGNVLSRYINKKGSLKTLIFGSNEINARQKRLIFALVDQTCKYKQPLEFVYKELFGHKVALRGLKLSREAILILLYQLLVTKSLLAKVDKNPGVSKFIASFKDRGLELLQSFCDSQGVQDVSKWADCFGVRRAQIPRYARVNCAVTDSENISALLAPEFQNGTVEWDKHLKKELLVFPPGTDLHANRLVVTGQLVLQDKASCLPAFLLAPKRGSYVIDCCAAPGNKTTHVASVMRNEGHIYAFDKSVKRFELLKNTVERCHTDSITTCICDDFLNFDFSSASWTDRVTHVLCDPSCSGSGIGHEEKMDSERLLKLAEFQFNILCKSLSLPNVKRVCYSTCSVNLHENEYVVSLILGQHPDFRLVPRDQMLPTWPRRGMAFGQSDLASMGIEDAECVGLSAQQADCLIRCLPEDGCNGFFVAIFERI